MDGVKAVNKIVNPARDFDGTQEAAPSPERERAEATDFFRVPTVENSEF
jgi:hypothetical protein